MTVIILVFVLFRMAVLFLITVPVFALLLLLLFLAAATPPAMFLTLQSCDASHNCDAKEEKGKERQAVVAVELDLWKQIGERDEEKRPGGKRQGGSSQLALQVLLDPAVCPIENRHTDWNHQRKAELHEHDPKLVNSLTGENRRDRQCVGGFVEED